jgi:hypothetical protein
MAYTTINKSSEHFNTKLYTGNGSTNAQTGVGFEPSLTWLKARSYSDSHALYDAVRGVTKRLQSEDTSAEATIANSLTSFNSDGFTLGSDGQANSNNDTYASWNWLANGAGSANTAGSINSTVSANTTSGFSIVKYTGNGSSGATVGHGLTTTAPKIVLIKTTSGADAWTMLNTNIDLNKYLSLNSNSAEISDPMFNNTAPTTTVFTLDGDGQVNGNGVSLIAYCFSEVTGYSKFGSYKGNGANFDNAFVYTGFKPSLVIIKKSNTTGNWVIEDNKRAGYNQANYHLYPNLTNAEGTNYYTDFLSNGFKIRDNPSDIGESGHTYIYMAFAEEPLVANSGSNGVPATAR